MTTSLAILGFAELVARYDALRSAHWAVRKDLHDEIAARVKLAGIVHHDHETFRPTRDGSFSREATMFAPYADGRLKRMQMDLDCKV